MLEIYTLPDVRLYAISNILGAALETILTSEEIPAELGGRLTGLISVARAEAIRLSDELDPTAVTILPRTRLTSLEGNVVAFPRQAY
ncbi:hypothetical protein AFCDBAGC_4688 [Methylobacterium cerastii]|uniref:Uncharacterized protein n=1 Tax=Methylobacterium cerastii TaxID=932741 RepID=A0ABQ4QPY8_9HYPH|nr:hypothetical protein [Methylobacterium cerastii]GJD46804.1 hypothetical protein AFCDBAGC_4688 [Methylobacterium cerastii]